MSIERRSNDARSRATRLLLLDAARTLFVDLGYAGCSTPLIVQLAKTTRGALYHHFPDKRAIFRAVLEREAHEVAQAIEEAEGKAGSLNSLDRLLLGAKSYLMAMQVQGRTRLLLVDGPAVLGASALAEIEGPHARQSLQRGLEDLTGDYPIPYDECVALSEMLSAMFDTAALKLAAGAEPTPYLDAISRVLHGLATVENTR